MPLTGILKPLAYRIIESGDKVIPCLFRVFLLVQVLFPALQELLVEQLFNAFVNGLGEKVLLFATLLLVL